MIDACIFAALIPLSVKVEKAYTLAWFRVLSRHEWQNSHVKVS